MKETASKNYTYLIYFFPVREVGRGCVFQNPIFLSGRETSNGLLFCTERNNLGIFSRTFVIALTSLSHSENRLDSQAISRKEVFSQLHFKSSYTVDGQARLEAAKKGTSSCVYGKMEEVTKIHRSAAAASAAAKTATNTTFCKTCGFFHKVLFSNPFFRSYVEYFRPQNFRKRPAAAAAAAVRSFPRRKNPDLTDEGG